MIRKKRKKKRTKEIALKVKGFLKGNAIGGMNRCQSNQW